MMLSKEYSENLEKGIITEKMLCDCLYSVNKRAKNARDMQRRCALIQREDPMYYQCGDEYAYGNEKLDFYSKKESLLSIVEPKCIHVERQERKRRVYSYDSDYWVMISKGRVVYSNYYYDYDMNEEVQFADVLIDVDKYYLFYDFGDFSFHQPIDFIDKYNHLEKVRIEKLITHGADVEGLIPVEFVNGVIELIKKGTYTYLK